MRVCLCQCQLASPSHPVSDSSKRASESATNRRFGSSERKSLSVLRVVRFYPVVSFCCWCGRSVSRTPHIVCVISSFIRSKFGCAAPCVLSALCWRSSAQLLPSSISRDAHVQQQILVTFHRFSPNRKNINRSQVECLLTDCLSFRGNLSSRRRRRRRRRRTGVNLILRLECTTTKY